MEVEGGKVGRVESYKRHRSAIWRAEDVESADKDSNEPNWRTLS